MSLKDNLKNIRYMRWVKPTDDSFSFTRMQIYPLIRVEGDNDLILVDNSGEEIYVEPEDIQFLQPVTDEEYRNQRASTTTLVQINREGVVASIPQFSIAQQGPTIVELNVDSLPYWAQYVTINNDGVWVTTDAPDEVSKMKEKLTLDTPIVIKVPKRKIPMEVLANMFKDGKITYAEFEEEMKKIVGGVI